MDGPDDPSIENNAFFCPTGNEITYWRPRLARYAEQYSDMMVGLVLAHEMGHAIQDREGVYNVRSIVAETQADCFAGTWARSVADKKDPHFKYNPANMDQTLLVWAKELPSEVGSDPNNSRQHGSAFDRVSAFQEGYEDGPQACKKNFKDSRLFTSMEFTKDNASDDGQGNSSYEDTVNGAQKLFDAFYAAEFPQLNATWSAPRLLLGGSGDSSCPVTETISYCAANNAVVISDELALREVHKQYGDYAVITAMGLAYGTAAIVQLKYSADDPLAMIAAGCLTGAVSGELIDPNNAYKLTLSPGDFDEATVMLLTAGKGNTVVNTGDLDAFQRMDAFRTGVNGGVSSCQLGG